MRIKAVPDSGTLPMEDIFKNKWVLWGGVAALAIVGYVIISNANANAQPQGDGTLTSATPVSTGGIPTVIQSGPSGNSGAGMDTSSLIAAINAEAQQQANQQQTQLAAIQAQTNIAIANDQTAIQTAEISQQVSNFASSTNVLSQYLQVAPKNLAGVGGAVNPTPAGGVNFDVLGYTTGGKNTVAANLTGSSIFNSVTQGAINVAQGAR